MRKTDGVSGCVFWKCLPWFKKSIPALHQLQHLANSTLQNLLSEFVSVRELLTLVAGVVCALLLRCGASVVCVLTVCAAWCGGLIEFDDQVSIIRQPLCLVQAPFGEAGIVHQERWAPRINGDGASDAHAHD